MEPKYRIGDVVKIIDNLEYTIGGVGITHSMVLFSGRTVTIRSIRYSSIINEYIYEILEDNDRFSWGEHMFDGYGDKRYIIEKTSEPQELDIEKYKAGVIPFEADFYTSPFS